MAYLKGPMVAICFVVALGLASGQGDSIPNVHIGGLDIRVVHPTTTTTTTSTSTTSTSTSTSPTSTPILSTTSTSTSTSPTSRPVSTSHNNASEASLLETTHPSTMEPSTLVIGSENSTLEPRTTSSPNPTSSITETTILINASRLLTTLAVLNESTTPSKEAQHPTTMNSSVHLELSTETSLPTTGLASSLAPTSEHVTGSTKGVKPKFSDFDCAGFDVGYYSNPKVACDTKFFICVDQSMYAYEEHCPGKLYFDPDTKNCDMWAHIPACSGRTRPPIVVTNETHFTLSPIPPVLDCHNLTDGNYPDPDSTKPFCSNRFFTCGGGREFKFRCPRGTYYDHERNMCDLFDRVFACSGKRLPLHNDTEHGMEPTLPPVNFDCRGKADGYYVEKCDSVYYSCNGGYAREFHCPDGLVFESSWLSCESPRNTFVCTGTHRPSTTHPPSTTPPVFHSTTPSPLDCVDLKDGIYRDPLANCSRNFYYCAHGVSFQNLCPGNLYYDEENKRCDLWINVFACSNIRPTPTHSRPTTTAKPQPVYDFDCTKLDDGDYVNPNNSCSHFFYICANMETFQQFCPAGLYYDPDHDTCDAFANIYACTGQSPKPTEASLNFTVVTREIPEFDCSEKDDGVYFNTSSGCSNVYYRCSAANTFKFTCPAGLFYDITIDACDRFEIVFACSGHTRPSPPPSTASTTRASTDKPPVDCRSLTDGEYADAAAKNSCSHFFYTCSAGLAIKRECAAGTFYDPELRTCDSFWKVPICTGEPRPNTTTPFPTTQGSPKTPPPFDCTKLFDGNYANGNCSTVYWSCIGGMTFKRSCPMEFVYDRELDECEYPAHLPECGGERPTQPPTVITFVPTKVGGFSCDFRSDGNYVDPSAADGCSTIYYTCSNGITTQVHCPGGLYFDIVTNLCNNHDMVPACGGRSLSNATTSVSSGTTSSSSNGAISSASSALISESTSSISSTSGSARDHTVSTSGSTSGSERPTSSTFMASSMSPTPTPASATAEITVSTHSPSAASLIIGSSERSPSSIMASTVSAASSTAEITTATHNPRRPGSITNRETSMPSPTANTTASSQTNGTAIPHGHDSTTKAARPGNVSLETTSMAGSNETTMTGRLLNSTESGTPHSSTESTVRTTIGNLLTTMSTFGSSAPSKETTVTESSLVANHSTSVTGKSELSTSVSIEANGTMSSPESTIGKLNATETSPSSESSLPHTAAGNASLEPTTASMVASTSILSTRGGHHINNHTNTSSMASESGSTSSTIMASSPSTASPTAVITETSSTSSSTPSSTSSSPSTVISTSSNPSTTSSTSSTSSTSGSTSGSESSPPSTTTSPQSKGTTIVHEMVTRIIHFR